MASEVAEELFAKHKNSTQPSSRTLCAVLEATLEVLQAEGLTPSPAALFAAVMASLEKPEGSGSPEVAAALCTILSCCLPRIPNGLVRAKFVSCSKIILSLIDKHSDQANVMRSVVSCLGQVSAALDPNDWPSAAGPFGRLLALSLDARPKIRRHAQAGVIDTLAAIQGTPASGHASDTILNVCKQVLPGPEAALKATAGMKSKRNNTADSLLQKAVADVVHLLNLLKTGLPLLTGTACTQIAGMLPKLMALQQPLITRQALDTLAALLSSHSHSLTARGTAKLVESVVSAESAWEMKDSDVHISLIKLVETGYSRLMQLDAQLCLPELEEGFDRVVPHLGAAQDGVRLAAQLTLKNLIHECVHGQDSQAFSQLRGVFKALERSLGPVNQDSWLNVLPVVEELVGGLQEEQTELARPLLEALARFCSVSADTDSELEEEVQALGKAASQAVGAAIRSMGPKSVLSVLPLNIDAEEGEDSRLWLLPLLRQNVGNTSLDFWGAAMLPVARSLIDRAQKPAASQEERLRNLQYQALEAQIWGTLPAFCSWPVDVAPAFRRHAQSLGKAFQNREDLRPPICAALDRLCSQARLALQASGVKEGLGYSLPSVTDPDADQEEEPEADASIPPHYTAEVAAKDTAALKQFAQNWMPLLFNAFVAAKPGYRSHLGKAIAAYSTLADPALLDNYFKTIVKKLIKEVAENGGEPTGTEGGETSSERKCTFMELALCLTPGLPTPAISVLHKAAVPALQEKDQAVQKRAYKLLAYILEEREDFAFEHFQEVVDSLLLGVGSSMSAAKRYRLRCLKAAILMLQDPEAPEISATDTEMAALSQAEQQKQVIAMLVSEIVLCIKEVNKKTRVAAYELLVGLAKSMHEANPPPAFSSQDVSMDGSEGQDDRGGLYELFTMLLGGLVGATPHMISASVMALARLLYEFAPHLEASAPRLLPVILSLLRSKSREVIKSVLGFVKVCAIRLPVDMLQEHLKDILEGILIWSEDSKNKFKLKVRMIVERLVRRLDYETVAEQLPEEDRKLLTHIRKEQQRKVRKSQSEAGSQVDGEVASVAKSQSRRTSKARSEWAHSHVFSDDEEGRPDGRAKSRASMWGDPSIKAPTHAKSKKEKTKTVRFADLGDEPMDLLDPANSRAMQTVAAGQARTEPAFPLQGDRMVIDEEEPKQKPKRKRGGGIDTAASDDSDFDDLHHLAGATAALRLSGRTAAGSTAGQTGLKSTRSLAGKSTARSSAGRSTAGRTSKTSQQGKEHSGKRFAASKKGAGGDVKGKSKVEPYAYWPLDRKMLNRRTAKKTQAAKGLQSIVQPGAGSLRGHKAKKQKR